MKLTSIEFAHIKSFRSLKFSLDGPSVLIGQNDHGKSSILKAIDIVLNQLDKETIALGALHPDLAERLLPIFPVNAKARRVTLNCQDNGTPKQLHVTVRSNLAFAVHDQIERNVKTTPASLDLLQRIRDRNKFVLIPALRDATSSQFQGVLPAFLGNMALQR